MNENIRVYGFLDADGVEQEYTTLDAGNALKFAKANGFKLVIRVYEYSHTIPARKFRVESHS